MNYFEMGVQKYWSPTAAMPKEVRQQHLQQMIESGQYLWSEKFDGNFTRAVITKDRNALQTRGISKVTGTYSELQDKVFFWDAVVNAFQNGDTVILGELYLSGGRDKDVGAICRCLTPKARARQKDQKLEWKIFDVLALDGRDMINEPIEVRSKYIEQVVARINHPLVTGVPYHEMNNKFFDELNEIFARGGEGAVCYRKHIVYTPDKRTSAWDTVKVKQEITDYIDCVIMDVVPCEKNYNGDDMAHWTMWKNTRTGEIVQGEYFSAYQLGEPYIPISRNYFYNYPGAMTVGVYNDKHELIPLCNVAGLTDELKARLRDDFDSLYLCPVSIGGMMISNTDSGLSIRHPYLHSIRENDIRPEDCTLNKILK